MFPTYFANLTAKAGIGLAATTFALGGAGAAGALPRPVQAVVSDAASHLGIDISDDAAVNDEQTDTNQTDDAAVNDDQTDTNQTDDANAGQD